MLILTRGIEYAAVPISDEFDYPVGGEIMYQKFRKVITIIILFGLLTTTMQPVSASNEGNTGIYFAYVHDHSSETEDELNYLSNLANKNYDYDEYDSKNIDNLWKFIENYDVILLEISDNDEYLKSEFSNHKTQIENWIKGGGKLYVSLYGDESSSTLNWLPADLVVTSNKLDENEYDIISDESTIIATKQNKNVNIFTFSEEYTPIISVKTENIEAPILITKSYGAGEITLSNGEFEKGFHPEMIEPMFVITASAVAIFALKAVATYVIKEYYIKPTFSPAIASKCKEHELQLCDDENEADLIIDGALFGLSLVQNAAKEGAIKSMSVAHAHHVAWLNGESWGKGLMVATLNKATERGTDAFAETAAEELFEKVLIAPNDPIRNEISSIIYTSVDTGMDNYVPDYTTQTSYYPEETEITHFVSNSYDAYVNPIFGYYKSFNIDENTRRLRIYLSAEVNTCNFFTNIKNPLGIDKTPIPNYFGGSTTEYVINNPEAGRWEFIINPTPDIADKTGVVIIQQDKYKGKVLFDISHEEWFAAAPSSYECCNQYGSWSTFAEELENAGFKVDILNQDPITDDKLNNYDVFVFGGWAHQILTTNEINAIDQFVNDGGGLLLSFDEYTENVYNPLSNKYGVEFMQNVGLDDPTDDETSSYAPVLHVASTHPIFENVAFSQFYWVHYLKRVDPPSKAVLFSDGDTIDQNGNPAAYKPMIAVAEVGNGKVVSVADANMWNNWDWDGDGSADIYDRDNLQLGINIISWLSNIDPLIVSSSKDLYGAIVQSEAQDDITLKPHNRRSSGYTQNLKINAQPNLKILDTPQEILLVEYEEVSLDINDEIEEIKDEIAIYGTGNIELVDIVPIAASLNFDNEPDYSTVIGDNKQLTWNNINLQGYTRIGYSISNVAKDIPQQVQISSTILPNTISKDHTSEVIIKYELDMLESADDVNLNFLIPKSTNVADISINDIPDAMTFDTGTHYRVTYKLGSKYAGEHKTIYTPLTITPKGNGELDLIQQPHVSIVTIGSTFLAEATSDQINQAYRRTSFNHKLEEESLTIADTADLMPTLTSPNDGVIFLLEQGKMQSNSIKIINEGDLSTSVNLNLKNAVLLPNGIDNIETSWISFSDEAFQLDVDEIKMITLTANVPETAKVGTYIGNVEISDEIGSKTKIPILLGIIEKDLFKFISVSSSLEQILPSVTTELLITVVDDDGNPINDATVLLTGAGVDVSPVNTGADGTATINVHPMEAGIILVSANKFGYISGQKNIVVEISDMEAELNYIGDLLGQYSDSVTLKAQFKDSKSSNPLKDKAIKFSLGTQTATAITGSDGIASANIILDQLAGNYDVKADFAGDDDYSPVSETEPFTINPEDAACALDDSNPVAVKVAGPGGNSGEFSLAVDVNEAVPDIPDIPIPYSGDLSLAEVSMRLVPVGPGSPVEPSCSMSESGTGYDATLTFNCEFSDVPVNTYEIQVTVDGGYYTGSGEDVLVVYDPSLGFTTGGGTFLWPGTNEKTNFGYTMKYNKKATNIKGNLLLVRHLSDGTIYRVKSNALNGLAIGELENIDGTYGWASFSGKTTYLEPGWPEPVGNHEFIVYVEDHNEPGNGEDSFWIKIKDQNRNEIDVMSMNDPAENNAVELNGGNIVVPHK